MNTTKKPPLGFENSSKLEQSLMETLMSEASQKSNPTTSVVTPNAISSLASEAGASPCSLPDGLQIAPCGPEVAPASHSAPQGKVSRKKTNAISGPCSSSLSASAALSMSLANRLQARLGTAGSMEYRQTWKQKATPAGRPYWAHTASALRTNDKDFTGWPTPSGVVGKKSKGNGVGALGEWGGSSNPFRGTSLANVRCPSFELWMMGFPPMEWSSAAVLAMQSFPKLRRSSSARISKPSES